MRKLLSLFALWFVASGCFGQGAQMDRIRPKGIAVSSDSSAVPVAGQISTPDLITSSTPVRDIRAANFAGGAKCDGVTDDTTAIQAAVTAQNTLGGVVFIPPSLSGCGISATIISSSTAPVGIVGAGQGFSSLKALSTIAGPMFEKLDGFVGGRGLIQGVNFNCNQHAAESLLIESHRQLDMRDVGSQDCTSENEILGKTGATNLLGLQAFNLNIDNTLIAMANVASRPTYGLDLKNNVADSEVNTVLVNHTQTAGLRIDGVDNHFVKIHPWGYGPGGTIPNSWPTYGVQVTGTANSFEGCEIDNIHTAGFKQSASRLTIKGCNFPNADPNTPYMVEADAGTDTLHLHSNTLSGNWQVNPVNFLGTVGAHTFVFGNGFLTASLFPTDLTFQSMIIKNSADSGLVPFVDSGLTASQTATWSFRDRGTDKWQVGKFGSNDFRIRSIADSLDILQVFGGGDAIFKSPSGKTVFSGSVGPQDGTFGSSQANASSACEATFGITTLGTGATTTDTTNNCLPANSVIDAVVYRITTTITTAASFTIGDATTAGRFCAAQSVLTAGTTGVCFVQADQTGGAGPRQTAAAKVRVTSNVNPGAGAIRLIVYYHSWTAPTS